MSKIAIGGARIRGVQSTRQTSQPCPISASDRLEYEELRPWIAQDSCIEEREAFPDTRTKKPEEMTAGTVALQSVEPNEEDNWRALD